VTIPLLAAAGIPDAADVFQILQKQAIGAAAHDSTIAFATWVSAGAAVAIAIATVCYVIITRRLWLETKRQAELTKRIFEAENRPYLSIEITWRIERPGLMFHCDLRNHGGVPAVLIRTSLSVFAEGSTSALANRVAEGSNIATVFPGKTEELLPLTIDGDMGETAAVGLKNFLFHAAVDYSPPSAMSNYHTRIRAKLDTKARQMIYEACEVT
jgi:hypothetical protein